MASEAGKASEHGVGLLESHIWNVGAVAGVPAQRRPAEPPWLVDQEEHELERVREADEVKLRRGGERTVAFCESSARRKRA